MKVGDRVIYINSNKGFEKNAKAIVMEINDERLINYNIRIRFENRKYESGENVTIWVKSEEIILNKEWYREEKLKELGI